MRAMPYKMSGHDLMSEPGRECGHAYLIKADAQEPCELCNIDWLLETGLGENPGELEQWRHEVVAELAASGVAYTERD